jgi:hypothetical protein
LPEVYAWPSRKERQMLLIAIAFLSIAAFGLLSALE